MQCLRQLRRKAIVVLAIKVGTSIFQKSWKYTIATYTSICDLCEMCFICWTVHMHIQHLYYSFLWFHFLFLFSFSPQSVGQFCMYERFLNIYVHPLPFVTAVYSSKWILREGIRKKRNLLDYFMSNACLSSHFYVKTYSYIIGSFA
jgi:hypothetical protein